MAEREYPWTFVEKKGRGHEIFADELPRVANFFAAHPRDLYRHRVWIEAGRTLLLEESEAKRPRWPKAYAWVKGRPLLYDTCHWAGVHPLDEESDEHGWRQRALVELAGANEVHVRSQNVAALRLHLHPRMFDLAAPLKLVVNGEEQAPVALPQPDLGRLLESVRRFDDRGRVFHNWVDVDIADDAATLPPPSYAE